MSEGDLEQFKRLSALFDELVELGAVEREQLISDRCASDAGLAAELRAMLAADSEGSTDDLLQSMIAGEAASMHEGREAGRRLGPWEIVRPLGEGGMGTVFLAERVDGEYESQAAIKLVRGGVPSPLLDERFRSERQILAGLSHPGIARLLDGGSTDDGTPYLVLEYVDGLPITEWCERNELSIRQRLELFARVCESVAYAHSALVAHRDLKPSNILVTPEGEPKLLDFGIAKLMDAVEESSDGVTATYGLMTPSYASPEQVSGNRAGVAADVYSLGVLLYQMLAGKLPLETKGLTPAALVTRITLEVPAAMSTVVDTIDLKRVLTGDLDSIVSQALRKEPENRYGSVQALGDDVRRYLDGLPIEARGDDWSYRTMKLMRRNRGVVSTAALILILGVAFTINTVLQSRAIAVQRDRAEAERAVAVQVSGFLEELLTEADPNQSDGREVTAREVLDRGAERVFAEMGDDPEIQAALAVVMGRVYRGLGEYDAAEPLLDSALAVRQRIAGVATELLGEAYQERGALAYDIGDYDRTVEMQHAALEAYQAGTSGDSDQVAQVLGWISVVNMDLGNAEVALDYGRQEVEMQRRLTPEGSESLATALVALQDVLRSNSIFDEAVTVGEEGLAMTRALHGEMDLDHAHALNQLASSYRSAGRPEDGLPLAMQSAEIRRTIHGGPHIEVGASLGNVANMYSSMGQNEEAVPYRLESAQILEDIFGPEHPYVAMSTASVGFILMRVDRLDEAEERLRTAVEYSRMAFPPGHANTGNPLTGIGQIHLRRGEYAEAEVVLREAYQIRSEGLPPRNWETGVTAGELGRALDGLGRHIEAEPFFIEGYEFQRDAFGEDDARTQRAKDRLREHLEARGLTERVAELDGSGR